MIIDTPPCHFCQSETQNTFCPNCAINHNLVYVQTFNNSVTLTRISCRLKNKRFSAVAIIVGKEIHTRICQIEQEYVYNDVLTLHNNPLTPSNIMDKLPIYLTFL